MKGFLKTLFSIATVLVILTMAALPLHAQALRGDFIQVELLSSASRSNPGFTGGTISRMHNFQSAVLVLNMSAATGSGGNDLNVRVQHSPDGGTSWIDFASFLTHSGTTVASQVLMWTTTGPAT